jgi:phospholipid/cholesterol/gamma-HCH transport system permease protein
MRDWFINVGTNVLDGIRGMGKVFVLFGQVLYWLFHKWPRQDIIILQLYQIGNRSLPVVVATGLFVGMVLAVQTYYQFVKLNVQTVIGAVVGLSMVKELGPVLTGTMLAGRVGSAIAAEIGTMKVTEQIDALESLATNPVQFLVLPRFLACFLLTPVLTIVADMVGMIGGYGVAVWGFGISHHYYIYHTLRQIWAADVMTGVLKGFMFGMVIALVSCFKGFQCREGAEGVGRAATESVVVSFITILVVNFFLTLMLG